MFLVKSCESQFNLKTSKTLMVGTLHEYRQTEIEQIADQDEGKLTFNLIFDGKVVVDSKWFNAICGGAVHVPVGGADHVLPRFPGPFSAHIVRMDWKHVGNNKIEVEDSSIELYRSAPNAFVFCMSAIREKEDFGGVFPDYDDNWCFPSELANEFALELAHVLLRRIHSDYAKGIYIVPPETCMETLQIAVNAREVLYVDRDVHVRSGGDLTIEDFVSRLYDMAFIKPPRFAKEKEFRFHYTIVSEDRIVEPLVSKLIVDAESLISLVI